MVSHAHHSHAHPCGTQPCFATAAQLTTTHSGTLSCSVPAYSARAMARHPHRLLRIVAAVAERHIGRGQPLQVSEPRLHLPRSTVTKGPVDEQEKRRAAHKAQARGDHDSDQHFGQAAPLHDVRAGCRHRRADQTADEAVGLAHGDAEEVGEETPCHGAGKRGDHRHERQHARLHQACADRQRHGCPRQPADQVEHASHHYGGLRREDTCPDRGGNGIGGIGEPAHKGIHIRHPNRQPEDDHVLVNHSAPLRSTML